MRKIVLVLVLISLLVLPMIALSLEKIKECCLLNKTIKIDDTECGKGKIAAPNNDAAKDCGYNPADPTSPQPCAIGDKWGMFCIINTLYRITDWISYLLFAFVGVMIIIGAFTIVTAGGAPDKVSTGRNYILYAVVGLIVAFFAKAVPALVKAMVGM